LGFQGDFIIASQSEANRRWTLTSEGGADMMKKLLLIILAVFLLAGCAVGPKQIQTASVSPVKSDIKKIAVIDFEFDRPEREPINMGQAIRPKNAGSIMADLFAEKLLATGMYQLVERKQIKKVLDEHGFSMSGLLDNASLEEVGRILEVDGLVLGNVSEYADLMCAVYWGCVVSFSARLIDTKTGLVEWSVSGQSDMPLCGSGKAAHTSTENAIKELVTKMKKMYKEK
jgi:PBP1b-binding outer membrane lipoprotein LpoB